MHLSCDWPDRSEGMANYPITEYPALIGWCCHASDQSQVVHFDIKSRLALHLFLYSVKGPKTIGEQIGERSSGALLLYQYSGTCPGKSLLLAKPGGEQGSLQQC